MKSIDRIEEDLLVIRCIEGDAQAFERIVSLWQERLYRHAYQLTGEEDAAWDAVQETWAAVVSGIRKLREPEAFGGWVFRILGARCADWVRSRRRQRDLSTKLEQEPQSCDPPRPEHVALKQAIAKLRPEGREILSLRYTLGYSTPEISAILQIPDGTVKSRLHKAREQLRTLMERAL